MKCWSITGGYSNAIIHGYENYEGCGVHGEKPAARTAEHPGKVRLQCVLEGDVIHIEVEDKGKGIEDLEKAMEPLFTTRPELDRSGMGFSFMEAFMDDLDVKSEPGKGTLVRMMKKLGTTAWIECEE